MIADPVDRRDAIRMLLSGSAAVAVLGVGCTPEVAVQTTASPPTTTTTTTTSPIPTLSAPTGPGTGWEAVEFGVAKPYILHNEDGAVLIDTGKTGSAGAIEDVLTGLGLGWSDVRHIILTHNHRDNVGGVTEVSGLAASAQIWAGAEDIPDMPQLMGDQSIEPVDETVRIFGLTIVKTPGHTPGHISVLDEVSRFLVDGDLLIVRRDEISGPTEETSDDLPAAYASLKRLAQYDYDSILIARGEPILTEGNEIMGLIASGPTS